MLPVVVTLIALVAVAVPLGHLADRWGTATRGALLAVGGAGIATLALLTAPFLALPFVDGGTLPAALDLLHSYVPAVDLLWALPIGTALIAVNGSRLLFGADRGARWRRTTSTAIACGCVAVLVVLLGLALLPGTAASWVTTDAARVARAAPAAGYYLCVVGVAVSLLGARVAARGLPAPRPS